MSGVAGKQGGVLGNTTQGGVNKLFEGGHSKQLTNLSPGSGIVLMSVM